MTNETPEPSDEAIEEWVYGKGFQTCRESWMESGCGGDFVRWTELYWDDIIQWYIDDNEGG